MPQLMPLNWCISFLMIGLLFIMVMLVYFSQTMNYEFLKLKSNKNNIMNWKW